MFWNKNASNWYRLSFSNFHSSLILQPISAVHPALPAWRRTRATRSVGTWAWPDCSMAVRGLGALRAGRRRLLSAWGTWCSGTEGVRWMGISGNLSRAGRCPKQGVRKKIARQSQPGMHHASTWLSAFVCRPHLQARPRLLVVCAHMCKCLWHVKSLLWQPPYSNFHKM